MIFLILSSLISISFYYFIGYWAGWIFKILFGNEIINFLNYFNINMTLSQLPILCGILNVTSSFFKDTINFGQK